MSVLQSNLLLSLAGDVREAVSRYKRSSLESFEAYLTAGRKLVEARGECRRGQWAPFLEAAGVESRTARDMMTLARANLTAGQVFRHGGVRGALEVLRMAAARSLDAAVEALDRGDDAGDVGTEKTATVAVISPSVQGTVEGDSSLVEPVPAQPAVPVLPDPESASTGLNQASTGIPEPVSAPEPLTLRQWRRSVGRCADCGEHSPEAYRCDGCRELRSLASARAAARRRIGRELESRIGAAAAKGRGVRLTAADVKRLMT